MDGEVVAIVVVVEELSAELRTTLCRVLFSTLFEAVFLLFNRF